MEYFSSMQNIFYIHKYAFWSASEQEQNPAVDFIPALQRRRLTDLEKIGLFLIHELGALPKNYKTVFASHWGEWRQTFDLFQQYHTEKQISPAGFSHSVHNAMPGIESVLAKNTQNYTAIAAKENTLEAALTEAIISPIPTLLIYAEENNPEFYNSYLSEQIQAHGLACLISTEPNKTAQKIQTTNTFSNIAPLDYKSFCDFLAGKPNLRTSHLTIQRIP